jgi:hypothetical protein
MFSKEAIKLLELIAKNLGICQVNVYEKLFQEIKEEVETRLYQSQYNNSLRDIKIDALALLDKESKMYYLLVKTIKLGVVISKDIDNLLQSHLYESIQLRLQSETEEEAIRFFLLNTKEPTLKKIRDGLSKKLEKLKKEEFLIYDISERIDVSEYDIKKKVSMTNRKFLEVKVFKESCIYKLGLELFLSFIKEIERLNFFSLFINHKFENGTLKVIYENKRLVNTSMEIQIRYYSYDLYNQLSELKKIWKKTLEKLLEQPKH